MTISVSTAGAASDAVDRGLPNLVNGQFASRLFAGDAGIWGEAASDEAGKRLGWTRAHEVSEPLVDEIIALRDEYRQRGIDRFVLCGMGGSSLAPEVITRTAGVDLVVLDSTDPAQVAAIVDERLDATAVVVSSKSGSTIETDSQRRAFVDAFRGAGIDPAERIVIVTDPGSPLEESAREAGHRVFLADPNVGGRYSALTAFGLVPSGLAGADIRALIDQATAIADDLAEDSPENPALVLAAVMAGAEPHRTYLGIVDDGSGIVGFGDWAEQLIAESTGKEGTGVLPVVLETDSPEIGSAIPDLQLVRVVANAEDTLADGDEAAVSGPLGAQFLLWEVATAAAGMLLGINPFDQPDVESAKVAARGLLDDMPELEPASLLDDGIEARGSQEVLRDAETVSEAINALLAALPEGGYVAIQAYADRTRLGELAQVRDEIAKRARRPVTFGWGPRFLHSTGQFHKGGPAVGVFLQIVTRESADRDIPDRPFSFGTLIRAQADGDRKVLEEHGRPVLQLTLTEGAESVAALAKLLGEL